MSSKRLSRILASSSSLTIEPVRAAFDLLRIPSSAAMTLWQLLVVGSGLALAAGHFGLGGCLYLAGALASGVHRRQSALELAGEDAMSRARAARLRWGLERYADAAVFMGLGWFYQGCWVSLGVFAALTGCWLAAGGPEDTGRRRFETERVATLGFMVALSPIFEALTLPVGETPSYVLAAVGVILLALATHSTALRRYLALAGAPPPSREPAPDPTVVVEAPPRKRGVKRVFSPTFMRHVFSAGLATGTDLALVIALIEVAHFEPWTATLLGCAAGGFLNFVVNRAWTFRAKGAGAPLGQAGRYFVVSATSAALNAGAVALLLLLPAVAVPVAWVVARTAVLVTWNYPLQRSYVFAPRRSTGKGSSEEQDDGTTLRAA